MEGMVKETEDEAMPASRSSPKRERMQSTAKLRANTCSRVQNMSSQRQKCSPVCQIEDDLKNLLQNMFWPNFLG
jgi:hypothetical protein